MPRTHRISYAHYKEVSNTRISSRMKQFITLVLTIILGLIISVTVNARPLKHNAGNTVKKTIITQTANHQKI